MEKETKRCPFCESIDTEWNGATGPDEEWRCNDCESQWTPGEEEEWGDW